MNNERYIQDLINKASKLSTMQAVALLKLVRVDGYYKQITSKACGAGIGEYGYGVYTFDDVELLRGLFAAGIIEEVSKDEVRTIYKIDCNFYEIKKRYSTKKIGVAYKELKPTFSIVQDCVFIK